MEAYQQIVATLALAMGASWASGINLYATLLMLGFLGASGNMTLPPDLQVLQNPLVLGAAGLMYAVEFFADKTPGVDTGWDAIHTFVRIPAGALLAAGAVGDVALPAELAAAIVGGGMAAATHATKAGSRVIINTSPEPVSNWAASITEDLAVIGGLWTALNHPLLFLGMLAVFLLLLVWLLPKLWRAIKGLFARIARFFGGGKGEPPPAASNGVPPAGGTPPAESAPSAPAGGAAATPPDTPPASAKPPAQSAWNDL